MNKKPVKSKKSTKAGAKVKKKLKTKVSRSPANVKKASPRKTKSANKKTVRAQSTTKNNSIYDTTKIVGIGSSAGGLEALEVFFKNLTPDTGMAFVVISHQHPDHTSILHNIISNYTTMDVFQIKDQQKIKPNCVYISTPGNQVAIFNGAFELEKLPLERTLALPVDYFFRSLAQEKGEQAIAIILSGTGTDGTIGLSAIKGESGMIIVQEESTSKFSGMPSSAIKTGLVDYILPPSNMPSVLTKYSKALCLTSPIQPEPSHANTESILNKILF